MTTMRVRLVLPVTLASIALAGCIANAPPGPDRERPELSLQVRGAVNGTRTFRSSDPRTDSACALVHASPVRLVVSASDPGGVRRLALSVFSGTIDRSTIVVPTADDVTYRVDADARFSETLVISLTPPAPGRVRTGIVATLDASGPAETPARFAIQVEASDVAGNRMSLEQVDIWPADSGIICR
jgi:hypothetical protein